MSGPSWPDVLFAVLRMSIASPDPSVITVPRENMVPLGERAIMRMAPERLADIKFEVAEPGTTENISWQGQVIPLDHPDVIQAAYDIREHLDRKEAAS